MRNIVIITDGHLPLPAVLGGAVPTLVDSLAKVNESKKKWNIDIVSLFNNCSKEESLKYKYTKFIYFSKYKWIDIIDSLINRIVNAIKKGRKNGVDAIWKLYYLSKVIKVLKKGQYDAVIIENHGFLTNILNSRTVRTKYSGRVYYHLHNELPNSVNKKNLKLLKFIVISEYLIGGIHKRNIDIQPDWIYVLKNGIDISPIDRTLKVDEREEIRKKYGIEKDDFVVCFVGRITPEKGIKELIDAFKKIEKSNIRLLIVGSTEFGNNIHSDFEGYIYESVSQLKDRVISTGYIEHRDIWKFYQMSDIAVLPSMWEEPAGLTILEAMINGLYVITTNVGGVPEYFNSKYGLMLERNIELTDKLSRVIVELSEKGDYIRKNREAQKYVSTYFSEEVYFDNFARIIGKE